MNTVTIIDYLDTDAFIIIASACLFGLFLCLVEILLKKRDAREKCRVKQQLNDYTNKLLLISLDIICDEYRQVKKYTKEEIEDYIDKMYEVKGLMKMLE